MTDIQRIKNEGFLSGLPRQGPPSPEKPMVYRDRVTRCG